MYVLRFDLKYYLAFIFCLVRKNNELFRMMEKNLLYV
jgi:hypothetical protein